MRAARCEVSGVLPERPSVEVLSEMIGAALAHEPRLERALAYLEALCAEVRPLAAGSD